MNYIAKSNLLQHKTILVTGAGDGIGKQAALSYAEHGATVILLGRTTAKLEQCYDQIVSAGHPEPAIIPLDHQGATQADYQAMAQTIITEFAKLDGVLLNASLLGILSPLQHIEQDTWNQVMQVNVTSQFLMVQALLPALEKAPHASVIFTSSGVADKGKAFWGSYAVSKHATLGLMRTAADEYENSNIRFNAINPGATRTSMRAKAYPAEDPQQLLTPPI